MAQDKMLFFFFFFLQPKSMVNVLKFRTPKVANKMVDANSADPDQTAPEGAV